MKPFFGSNKPRVTLKKGKSTPLKYHHPWVFSGAIQNIKGNTEDGDLVDVLEDTGKFIAKGFINTKSQIAVRLLTWDIHEKINPDFFRRKIKEAISLREQTLAMSSFTSAYRLIHSEGDGLPGLTVDRYNDFLTVQFLSVGMDKRRDLLIEILLDETKAKGAIERYSPGSRRREGLEDVDCHSYGQEPPETLIISEYGVKFQISLKSGQKTGFYLDQRESRHKLSRLGYKKRILDGFCYTGGFGISLATKSRANEIIFMDSSASALDLAQVNWKLNEMKPTGENEHKTASSFIKADIFDKLPEMERAGEKFDLIILDPPKVAPDTNSLRTGMDSLEKINQIAMRMLNPNGVLVSCDCSGLISWDDFLRLINKAANEASRTIKIFDRLSAGPDHPVNPACLENTYLKTIMAMIP